MPGQLYLYQGKFWVLAWFLGHFRVPNFWPCGSVSPRPMSVKFSTKHDRQLHVFSSSTSWTLLPRLEVWLFEKYLYEFKTRWFHWRWCRWRFWSYYQPGPYWNGRYGSQSIQKSTLSTWPVLQRASPVPIWPRSVNAPVNSPSESASTLGHGRGLRPSTTQDLQKLTMTYYFLCNTFLKMFSCL